MDKKIFSNIGKIIERDSKSTTYKFALLRGTIDIIQENSPYIYQKKNRVYLPTGLLIEKWLLYYYPIFQSKTLVPQINGNSNLAFELKFNEVIKYYEPRGGFSAFYNDLRNKGFPNEINKSFFNLVKQLLKTITDMPMKYIGKSVNSKEYSIYKFENNNQSRKITNIGIEELINNFGVFSIPLDYYEVFQILGSFLNGQDSILFKWAEFSVNASNQNLSTERVLNEILKSPITERNISESKKIYKEILEEQGDIYCVWTGKKLANYEIDHLIPFSVWKNNDLWNLLPAKSTINKKKRDKIPSPLIIEKQKDLILEYWQIIYNAQTERFSKEIQVSLLGNLPFESWKKTGINQLKDSCSYLIKNRGFKEWKI
jgi:hypothetical protein